MIVSNIFGRLVILDCECIVLPIENGLDESHVIYLKGVCSGAYLMAVLFYILGGDAVDVGKK